MRTMRYVFWSSIVCGVFAVGCLGSAATEDDSVGQTDQDLGATTQAQERLITYYAEPALIHVVGSCFGPYRCVGPKGTTCTGVKSLYYTIDWFDCDTPTP